jgi:anti-anti-sigma regulatory factor
MNVPRDRLLLNEDEGLLVVSGLLDWRSEDEFQAACRRLLETDRRVLLVDLTEAAGISSANMSFLVNMHYWAVEAGKELRLRVGPDVAKVFDRTRLSDLVGMNIEKVERDAEQ